jgi:hypothetical protein
MKVYVYKNVDTEIHATRLTASRRQRCAVCPGRSRLRLAVKRITLLLLLISLASWKTACAQSEAHAIQFDLLKLENGQAIPQSFGDVPNELDVSYRVYDKERRPVESEVSFVDHTAGPVPPVRTRLPRLPSSRGKDFRSHYVACELPPSRAVTI